MQGCSERDGNFVYWSTGVVVYWKTVYWYTGVLVYWSIGLLVDSILVYCTLPKVSVGQMVHGGGNGK